MTCSRDGVVSWRESRGCCVEESLALSSFAVGHGTDAAASMGLGVETVYVETTALKMIPFLVRASLPAPVTICAAKIILGTLPVGQDRIRMLKRTLCWIRFPSLRTDDKACLAFRRGSRTAKVVLKSMPSLLAQRLAGVRGKPGACIFTTGIRVVLLSFAGKKKSFHF